MCSRRYPVVTGCDVENGKKRQPDYAGGVHGESNKLGLVEVLGALPGLEGIPKGRDSHFDIKIDTTSRKKPQIPTHLKIDKTSEFKPAVKHLHSTQDDQEHIISQRQQHAGVANVALEDDSLSSFWQREAPCPGNFQQQPN